MKMTMFSRNMLNDRLWRKMPPPSCRGCHESPDSGSFKYAHAMNPHARTERAPTIDMTGVLPTLQFTGEPSKTSFSLYGRRMAAIDVRMNDRMNPKMPTSVLNGESGRVYNQSAAIDPKPMTTRALIGVCVLSFTRPSQEGPTPSIPYARRFREALVICPGSQVYDQKMNPIAITTATTVLPTAYEATSV